jgi:hypothetical protein
MESHDIIRTKLLVYMGDHYSTLKKFSSTCQVAWRQILFRSDLWITNAQWYNNCHLNATDRAALGSQPGVSPIVIVTPMRTVFDPKIDNTTYQFQMKSMRMLCKYSILPLI